MCYLLNHTIKTNRITKACFKKTLIMKELIIIVLDKLKQSNYVDTAEHLYDAIKVIKTHLDDTNLDYYVDDFLWGLESDSVIDIDGVVEECCNLIHNFRILKNKK